jgi:mono/diheme cytochrome c family protein
MRTVHATILLLLAVANLAMPAARAESGRWYSPGDLERGRDVFAANCAVCHGAKAQGATLGDLKAPPLNGGGHSAHHGLDYLLEQVANGGGAEGRQDACIRHRAERLRPARGNRLGAKPLAGFRVP